MSVMAHSGRFIFFAECVASTGGHARNQRIVLDERMELKHLGCAVVQMTVTHDGSSVDLRAAAAVAFAGIAVVNGTSGPSAPMGVVGPKIVTEFVRHHVEVPRVTVDVGARAAGHPGAESVGKGSRNSRRDRQCRRCPCCLVWSSSG